MMRERWILLVDDQEDLREVIASQLQSLGYRVRQAPSAQVALALVSMDSQSYYAVVTDFNMPRKSGLSLIAELESHRSRFRHRVLMSGDPVLPPEGIRFLRKPFSAEELESFMKQLEKS